MNFPPFVNEKKYAESRMSVLHSYEVRKWLKLIRKSSGTR